MLLETKVEIKLVKVKTIPWIQLEVNKAKSKVKLEVKRLFKHALCWAMPSSYVNSIWVMVLAIGDLNLIWVVLGWI
jgi:hypothetical protein